MPGALRGGSCISNGKFIISQTQAHTSLLVPGLDICFSNSFPAVVMLRLPSSQPPPLSPGLPPPTSLVTVRGADIPRGGAGAQASSLSQNPDCRPQEMLEPSHHRASQTLQVPKPADAKTTRTTPLPSLPSSSTAHSHPGSSTASGYREDLPQRQVLGCGARTPT